MKAQNGLLWPLAAWLIIAVNFCTAAWPNGPLRTDGRWITDASGNNVTLVGANWPGHEWVMIPEGLQYLSIADIVSKIKSLGMNAVRLTYAIQMIDQLDVNGGNGGTDVTIEKALVDALGSKNGTAVLQKIIENNPEFSVKTTRFQVWDAVAAECAKQEVYILLDNHISKAGWCCSPFDGNSWWGDTYFSATNWTNGLAYMANYTKTKWPSLIAMSLRNELRQPLTNMRQRLQLQPARDKSV
ncbi:hypothetical protein N0V88_002774 [Collariella sp. IMI 366227]|nr:hypothetical protein N0V88_002774 [Collariella sp. IMI 366227]